jgi:hypothetical protein
MSRGDSHKKYRKAGTRFQRLGWYIDVRSNGFDQIVSPAGKGKLEVQLSQCRYAFIPW